MIGSCGLELELECCLPFLEIGAFDFDVVWSCGIFGEGWLAGRGTISLRSMALERTRDVDICGCIRLCY